MFNRLMASRTHSIWIRDIFIGVSLFIIVFIVLLVNKLNGGVSLILSLAVALFVPYQLNKHTQKLQNQMTRSKVNKLIEKNLAKEHTEGKFKVEIIDEIAEQRRREIIAEQRRRKRIADEEMEVEEEIRRIKEAERQRKIREEAEKRLFGKVRRKKRLSLTEDERFMIFNKFHNQCVTCGKNEGLHIHHKDQNPSNNVIENLSVLCGVCHKKVHMKVR